MQRKLEAYNHVLDQEMATMRDGGKRRQQQFLIHCTWARREYLNVYMFVTHHESADIRSAAATYRDRYTQFRCHPSGRLLGGCWLASTIASLLKGLLYWEGAAPHFLFVFPYLQQQQCAQWSLIMQRRGNASISCGASLPLALARSCSFLTKSPSEYKENM